MIVSDSRSSPGLIPVVTLGRYLGISFSTGVLPVFHSAFRCFTLDNRSLFRLSLHLLPTLVIFQEGETAALGLPLWAYLAISHGDYALLFITLLCHVGSLS